MNRLNNRTRVVKRLGVPVALLSCAAISLALGSTPASTPEDLTLAAGQPMLKYRKGTEITVTGDLMLKSTADASFPPPVVDEVHYNLDKSCKLGSGGASCVSNSPALDAKAFKATAFNTADAKTFGSGSVSTVAGGNSIGVSVGFSGQFALEATDIGDPCQAVGSPADCLDLTTASATGELSTSRINGPDPVQVSVPFTVRTHAAMIGSVNIWSLSGACLNLDTDIRGTWSVSGVNCQGASGEFVIGSIGVDNRTINCQLAPGEYTLTVAYEAEWNDRADAACCQQHEFSGCAFSSGFNVNLGFQPSTSNGG